MRNSIFPSTTVIPDGPEAPGPLVGPPLIEGRPLNTVETWPPGVTLAMAPDGLAHAGSTPVSQPAGTLLVPASVTSRLPSGPTVIFRGWFSPVSLTTCTLAGNVCGRSDLGVLAPSRNSDVAEQARTSGVSRSGRGHGWDEEQSGSDGSDD